MSYAPGAPAQIWALTGVSDGAKLLALWWWGKADHDTQRDPKLCTVWAPAGTHDDGSRMTPHESLIADARAGVHPGKADRTLRGYIAELAAAGLADVDGRCVDLWPPTLAVMRQNVATPRRESAGEILPVPGENPPMRGEILPDVGENPPPQSYPPVPPIPIHDLPIASADPTPVLDSPPTPKLTKTRKRKPTAPKTGQTALGIADAPAPDDVAELLEAHRLAHAEHVPVPAWPARNSKRYASMAAGCRKAIAVHGVEWCRRMLAWRAGVWARDPSQHPYSTADVWRPVCLEYAKRAMGGSARASPSRTLPVEPGAPSREYVFPWTEPNT